MMFAQQRDLLKETREPSTATIGLLLSWIRPSTSNKRPFGIHHPSWSCWSAVRPRPFTLLLRTMPPLQLFQTKSLDTLSTNDEFIPHLRNLLLYHVVSGSFLSSDFEDGSQVTALNVNVCHQSLHIW
jgi:uncharacterized surface protein with fasciclin (FAS1) repeats